MRAALGSCRAYLRVRRPRSAEPFLRYALGCAAEHGFGRLVVRAVLVQCELAVCAGRVDKIGMVAQQAHALAGAGELQIEAAVARRWIGLGVLVGRKFNRRGRKPSHVTPVVAGDRCST